MQILFLLLSFSNKEEKKSNVEIQGRGGDSDSLMTDIPAVRHLRGCPPSTDHTSEEPQEPHGTLHVTWPNKLPSFKAQIQFIFTEFGKILVFMDTLKPVSEENQGNQLKASLKKYIIRYYICTNCTDVYVSYTYTFIYIKRETEAERQRQGTLNFTVTIV